MCPNSILKLGRSILFLFISSFLLILEVQASGGTVQWWRKYPIAQQRNIDSAKISLNKQEQGGHFALSRFYLGFENGDHHLNAVGVYTGPQFAEVTFADKQPEDDSFAVKAAWIGSNTFVDGGSNYYRSQPSNPQEARGTIRFPRSPQGYTRVLSGFYLVRQGGHDTKIRQIKVWPSSADEYEVSLTNFAVMNGSVTIPRYGSPLRYDPTAMIKIAMDWLAGAGHRAGDSKRDGFYAYLKTTLVPNSLIAWNTEASGANTRLFQSARLPNDREAVTLRGFEFNFEGRLAHNVLEIGVDVPQRRNVEGVFFQDNNRDDSMSWRLLYTGLKLRFNVP